MSRPSGCACPTITWGACAWPIARPGRGPATASTAGSAYDPRGERHLTADRGKLKLSSMRALQTIPAAVLLFTSFSAQAAVKLLYERKKAGETAPSGNATIEADADHIRMEGFTA